MYSHVSQKSIRSCKHLVRIHVDKSGLKSLDIWRVGYTQRGGYVSACRRRVASSSPGRAHAEEPLERWSSSDIHCRQDGFGWSLYGEERASERRDSIDRDDDGSCMEMTTKKRKGKKGPKMHSWWIHAWDRRRFELRAHHQYSGRNSMEGRGKLKNNKRMMAAIATATAAVEPTNVMQSNGWNVISLAIVMKMCERGWNYNEVIPTLLCMCEGLLSTQFFPLFHRCLFMNQTLGDDLWPLVLYTRPASACMPHVN